MIYTVYRLYKALLVSFRYTKKVFHYAITSKETATFTYSLTAENEKYLMNVAAQVARTDIEIIEKYFNELKNNRELRETIVHNIGRSPLAKKKDKRCDYGNKLALYAIIRVLKPSVIVENGVEMGFTSIVLCEALRRNIEENHPGKFIGLDVNKDAGFLIKGTTLYKGFSEIKYEDAIEGLKALNTNIGFYFSDGFRSYEYEQKEFASLEEKLAPDSIVITNKASFSAALFELSRKLNRNYFFFKEHPLGHWYEGAGLGIMHTA